MYRKKERERMLASEHRLQRSSDCGRRLGSNATDNSRDGHYSSGIGMSSNPESFTLWTNCLRS